MKHKKTLTIAIFVLFLAAVSMYIVNDLSKPSNPRVILDHHKQTYVTPGCFEQADATNFIEDSTLENAQEIGYKPNDECTESEILD
ncbi:hypothetical protein [Jeotgalibacillus soli]|uniref:Uncharacterized protein n=1 Tax=Jeotgalibacillus soli TaxID=889306 RepID=A0A0C2W1N4_9BACL|nr:hypothetical protein [Jeotgalibacillus soli]KIL50013.1 hypothetical protein KP78_14810 [Jeotgalibacillus soli]